VLVVQRSGPWIRSFGRGASIASISYRDFLLKTRRYDTFLAGTVTTTIASPRCSVAAIAPARGRSTPMGRTVLRADAEG
jgi:hypothetical protein